MSACVRLRFSGRVASRALAECYAQIVRGASGAGPSVSVEQVAASLAHDVEVKEAEVRELSEENLQVKAELDEKARCLASGVLVVRTRTLSFQCVRCLTRPAIESL